MNSVLSQLKDIASAVMYAAEATDLEQVLQRIADISRQLVNARYAALGVPDGTGGLQYFKVSGMTPAQVARLERLPRGYGLIGAILKERRTIRLENMAEDPRSDGFCDQHPMMSSLLGVPIQVGQRLFGVLYLCDRVDGQPFDEQDEWLIESMAGYAALAIGSSEIREQQNHFRLLEERERIGMELHDGIIQSLYATGMHLDLIRSGGDIKGDDLSPIIGNLNDIISDIRRYILNLQKHGEGPRTIRQYVTDTVTRLYAPDTLRIEIDAPDVAPPFAPATFEAICLIISEAVSNVMRHAEATLLSIAVSQEDNLLKIQIRDNGRGFELQQLSEWNGLGLRNIRQRARLHGGSVEIESSPGKGTSLMIAIPIWIV